MAEFLSDSIDFESFMMDTDATANVRPASEYTQSLCESLRPATPRKRVYLPWSKTCESFEFRPGEVTVWAGQNGHGKSHVARVVALSLMGQGERVCIANFEAKPLTTLRSMARMHAGAMLRGDDDAALMAAEKAYRAFGAWSNGKLWLYDQNGTTRSKKVLGMAKYCAQELGIDHVFIDNLAKCVKEEDDYNGQKAFVDEICALAADLSTHVHIVHHLRKPERETDKPDKGHVKGSGAIVDQPDNLMLVWRNKAKEEERKAGGDSKADMPDQLIYCRKQRNYEGTGEGEPTIGLWLHRDSGQFLGSAHESPMDFERPYPHRRIHHAEWLKRSMEAV